MPYCTECGTPNRDEARFCKQCGALVEPTLDVVAEEAPVEIPVQPLTVVDVVSQPGENPLSELERPTVLSARARRERDEEASAEPATLPALEEAVEAPVVRKNPLEAGNILSGRYRILHSHETPDAAKFSYQAEDLLRCWSCNAEQPSTQEKYCENCGAELKAYPIVDIVAWDQTGEVVGEQEFVDDSIVYRVQVALPPENPKPKRLQYIVGYQSDTGKEREIDEDSLLVLQLSGVCEMGSAPTLGLFVVADGIGGHAAGEVASRAAIRALAAKTMELIYIPEVGQESLDVETLTERLKQAILAANQAILDIRQENGADMGCTMTAALLRDDKAIVANIGDSRTYLMHNGKLEAITQDHSIIARMIEQGIIKPEERYTHEKKGVIYRSVGDKPDLEIDIRMIDLVVGDRLLLCCDGVWEMVRDPLLEDIMLEMIDPQSACNRLVEMANLAGGSDNISLIIVNVQ